MKKILFFLIAFSFVFAPVANKIASASEVGIADLDLLKYILEQAKQAQREIIAQEEIASKYPYKLKVLYPNGGEEVRAGETLKITWDALNSGVSEINIFLATTTDLYSAKNPGILIARDVPVNSIFYPWTVPDSMATGSHRILIRNSGKYKLSDYSDADFKFIQTEGKKSSVEITSIKGGESFITGRQNKISWKMDKGGERFVNIRLVKDGDSATSTVSIPTGIADLLFSSDNGVDWKIPSNIPTGEYRLKIFGVDVSCTYCLEPQAKNLFMTDKFKIVNAGEMPKKITLFSPNGDSDIILGQASSTVKISWFTPFDIDSVDIYLRSIPSGRLYFIKNNFLSTLSASSTMVEVDWVPEISNSLEEKVFMVICRAGTNYCDESDKPFSVIASTTELSVETTTLEPVTPEYSLLKEILNKIKDILEGKTEAPVVSTTTSKILDEPVKTYLPYTFSERLSVGLEDNDAVRALQEALTKEGLFDHAITGNFGQVTEKAVQEFQTKYDLEPSGSTGPGTQARLNQLYGVKVDVLQTVQDIVDAMNASTKSKEINITSATSSKCASNPSKEDLDTTILELNKRIKDFSLALEKKDIEKSLEFIVPIKKEEYKKIFESDPNTMNNAANYFYNEPVLTCLSLPSAELKLKTTKTDTDGFYINFIKTDDVWFVESL